MADAVNQDTASRPIVVGVDGSSSSRVALGHAARRTGPDGRLVIAHVMNVLPEAVAVSGELESVRRDMARKLVDELGAVAEIDAEPEVLEGRPAEALADLARRVDAREIVVGTRGLGRFAAALGSVSHALLGEADRPVVVVPGAAADHPRATHQHGQCTVIVGYDGSPPARAALAYAASRAADGGRVIAVHSFQPTPDWLGTPYYESALNEYQTHGRELLRSLEAESDLGADVTTSLLEGPPARAIVAAADARDADEIVVGSRGLGAVRGVLGSVSHAVLHEADRPVVVIPADAL